MHCRLSASLRVALEDGASGVIEYHRIAWAISWTIVNMDDPPTAVTNAAKANLLRLLQRRHTAFEVRSVTVKVPAV